jgi:phage terminase large subunit
MAVTDVTVTIPYAPRKEQRTFHRAQARFKVLVAHRRLGKTVAAVNEGMRRTTACRLAAPQGAYIAPFRNQAKRVAWGYVKQYTKPIAGMDYNEAELTATFPNGAKFFLAGGDNVHALRGLYLDHVVIDEVAQCHPDLWGQVLRPALSDRRGSGTFIGTPMGKNTFWRLYAGAATLEDWARFHFPASATRIIAPAELLALRAEMTDDEYLQEYECSFEAAIRGAYLGKAMRQLTEAGRICEVPWAPELEVYTAHDLGSRDGMITVYYQVAPSGQVRVIDCDALYGAGLADMVKAMRDKDYIYGGHDLPHDVKVTELGSNESRFERLWTLGVRGTILPNTGKGYFMDTVNAARSLLARTWFDATKCATLVEALRQWRAEWDSERQVLRATELHDWCADYAAAFRYAAIGGRATRAGFGSQRDLVNELERANARAVV